MINFTRACLTGFRGFKTEMDGANLRYIRMLVFPIIISIFVSGSVESQVKTNPPKRTVQMKVRMIDLYDKSSDAYCLELPKPIVGTVLNRKFDEDELTLVGFVIREKTDERSFVNIDTDYVAGKGRFVPSELSSVLMKGKRISIGVYGCGAAGALFYLDSLKEL